MTRILNHRHASNNRSGMSFLLVLLSLAHTVITMVHAFGKGSKGLFVISDRHVLMSDTSVDVLLIVDLKLGGVVETLRLHDRQHDPSSRNVGKASLTDNDPNYQRVEREDHVFLNIVSLDSCYDCAYFYFHSYGGTGARLYKATMKATWKSMAEQGDFSPFAKLNFARDFKPLQDEQRLQLKNPRAIQVSKPSGKTYVADLDTGLWVIDHDRGDQVQSFLTLEQLNLHEADGLALSVDKKTLYVTSFDHVAVVDLISNEVQYRLEFHNAFEDESRLRLHALTVDDDGHHAYVFSHPFRGVHAMALYRFSLRPSNFRVHSSPPASVQYLAGNVSETHTKWVDGPGPQARFRSPHDLHFLGTDANKGLKRILASDVDNRGLRMIEIQPNSKNGEPSSSIAPTTETYSIEYDDGLWMDYYFHERNKGVTFYQPAAYAVTYDATNMNTTNSATTRQTHAEMEAMCQQSRDGGRLCRAKEIRQGYSKVWNLLSQNNYEATAKKIVVLDGHKLLFLFAATCWILPIPGGN